MSQDLLSQTDAPVSHIMSAPVKCIHMDTTVLSAKRMFDKQRIHHFVVKENEQVVGVISDRDILQAMSPFLGNKMMARAQDERTLRQRIHTIMSRELVTIESNVSIILACKKMLKDNVSCLLVYENKSLAGILTMRDIVAWVSKSEAKTQD